ncbi:hypothetical protein AAG612_16095 [Citromicrobium bathyomarinum]|uniref:hypothetical protein n=1 Tax=Citromicrobium bathyomarinum TaxID=72174 RepID=UPI00315A485B
MYQYYVYGLAVHSEVELPFTERETAVPDVTIAEGSTEHAFGPQAQAYGLWRAERGALRLEDPQAGSVLVREGRSVTLESRDCDIIRVFLTGSALTALLQQRGLLTLHAGCVSTPAGAVAFAGDSGAGKSTLVYEMLRRGYPLVADDVTAIRTDEAGMPIAEPAYPALRLWQETMTRLEVGNEEATRRMPGIDKFVVPTGAIEADPVPVRAVYVLNPEPTEHIALEPLGPVEVFNALIQFNHRERMCYAQGLPSEHFALATRIARSVSAKSVRRPVEGFRIGELADAVEADFLALPR